MEGLMRIRSFMLLAMLGGACGDGTHNGPDAKTADAPVDAPFFKDFKANEGGEVRFEYINFSTGANAGQAAARVTAYNYKSAGTVPFYKMPNFQTGECFNADPGQNRWPDSQNPVATRIYEDPGFANGGVEISGGPNTFHAVAATADGFDGLHRSHPAGHYSFHYDTTANDAAMYAGPKQALTVTFPGSTAPLDPGGAAIPPQTFQDVMWVPANYQLLNPPPGSIAIHPHTAATFTWTMPEQGNPADHEIFAFVRFTRPMGLSTVCVYPNTGSITVPAAAIDDVIAKYPSGATLGRQTLTHVVRELVDADGPTGNRIDFITIWCNSAPFTVAP